jgi:hypothetical protein
VLISIKISPSVAVQEERRPNVGEAAKKPAVKNSGESAAKSKTAKVRQKGGKKKRP